MTNLINYRKLSVKFALDRQAKFDFFPLTSPEFKNDAHS